MIVSSGHWSEREKPTPKSIAKSLWKSSSKGRPPTPEEIKVYLESAEFFLRILEKSPLKFSYGRVEMLANDTLMKYQHSNTPNADGIPNKSWESAVKGIVTDLEYKEKLNKMTPAARRRLIERERRDWLDKHLGPEKMTKKKVAKKKIRRTK